MRTSAWMSGVWRDPQGILRGDKTAPELCRTCPDVTVATIMQYTLDYWRKPFTGGTI